METAQQPKPQQADRAGAEEPERERTERIKQTLQPQIGSQNEMQSMSAPKTAHEARQRWSLPQKFVRKVSFPAARRDVESVASSGL